MYLHRVKSVCPGQNSENAPAFALAQHYQKTPLANTTPLAPESPSPVSSILLILTSQKQLTTELTYYCTTTISTITASNNSSNSDSTACLKMLTVYAELISNVYSYKVCILLYYLLHSLNRHNVFLLKRQQSHFRMLMFI